MITHKHDPEGPIARLGSLSDCERGVHANLVTSRCQLISDERVITALLWLQQLSWQGGGLKVFAERLLETHAHLLGTKSMHKFGRRHGQVYSSDEVKIIRREVRRGAHGADGREYFPIKGERMTSTMLANWNDPDRTAEESQGYPEGYSVEKFLEFCEVNSDSLVRDIRNLLVCHFQDASEGLWYMPAFIDAVLEVRAEAIATEAARLVETNVTRSVCEALDFALEQRTFIVVEGREGIGKTEAAVNWCARNAGRAVYVALSAGTDELTFYRAIAKQLGTPHSLTKAEIRGRIEEALQPGALMLVLDESHFLWPQNFQSHRAPKLVDWLRTAIIDAHVPVALISTPQYFDTQCERFRQAGWNTNQIKRRVSHTETLPEELPQSDVIAVARRHFPKLDESRVLKIAGVALGSVGYLTTIRHVRERVDFFLARKKGTERELVDQVLAEKGLVSLKSGSAAAIKPGETESQGRVKTPLSPRGDNARAGHAGHAGHADMANRVLSRASSTQAIPA